MRRAHAAHAAFIGWLTSASVLSLGLTAPAPVMAAPSADEARAQALYDEGRSCYEAGDFDAALERWGEAYGLVSDAPENDHTRYQLLYSIASAHDRAYALDGDASHLRKARDLLLKCQGSAGEVFAGDEAALAEEQKRVRGLLDRVVDEMVEARPAGPTPVAEPEPEPEPTPEPEPEPEPTPTPTSDPEPAASPPAPAPADRGPDNGKALFGAGLGLIGVGAAGLGVMIAGMAMASGANDFSGLDPNDLDGRADQIRRGRLGNGLGVGGGIAAGLMIPVGIALTVAGRQKLKADAADASASVGAAVSREYVGVHWRGRF